MANKNLTLHIEKLDSGYVATKDGKKIALASSENLDTFLSNQFQSLIQDIRYNAHVRSVSLCVERKDNPLQAG